MSNAPEALAAVDAARAGSTASLRDLWAVLARRRRFVLGTVGGLLLLCAVYCALVPNQYEASARVELRTAPATALSSDGASELGSRLLALGDAQLETLASLFRSDQLAWRVIKSEKLCVAPGFAGGFARRYPGFQVDAPGPEAQAYLLERFQKRLNVKTLPRTLIVQIRFRSKDPALSAAVVNALIAEYVRQSAEARMTATAEATGWLGGQLKDLKSRVDLDDQRLAAFQRQHDLVDAPETLPNGQTGEVEHNTALVEMDELGRELVTATADRILHEAEYRAAMQGNPEQVLGANAGIEAQSASIGTGLLQQLHAHHSDLEQEASQLSAEHGPNFPRVVEIRAQLSDLDRQIAAEDAKLVERFRGAWKTASDREEMVRRSLEQATTEGMRVNEAATDLAVMREEAERNRELYLRVEEKAEEAGLTAGINTSNIEVVDAARQPVKPVSPDWPVDLAITLFVGLWIAVGGALLLETIKPSAARGAAVLLILIATCAMARAQAPTPSTSGIPAGVAHTTQPSNTRVLPNAKESPAVWGNAAGGQTDMVANASALGEPMPAPIGPGDVVEVSEFHTPEFRSVARVSSVGTVTLPLAGEVRVAGMDERTAAHAIEAALVARGMLLHPQVTVMLTVQVGQDVSVLGEVTRPGVYPFAAHHRLLDLISAASGLAADAGSLVTIVHRDEGKAAQAVELPAMGATGEQNPELQPGDTVEVKRAGLVYVVGDVMRPGGFLVDPKEHMTVVQALTLAWGPTPSAALSKALLIREQKGGRTVTTLNVKRLLHGQDPDLMVQDRDILFVPDSTAKNLWNRTLESAVQSAAGVSIYAGMVYSQRF